MNAKRFAPTAIALGLLCLVLLALPAQAQSYRGYTCEGLWEHVHAGGYVMYEKTSNWFYKTCAAGEETDDKEKNAEEPQGSPPDVTCPHLPPRVAVFGSAKETQCQMVGEVVIGKTDLVRRGFIDAVDVWSYVNGGLEVCFRNSGWLVFLDATYLERMVMELQHYTRDGMTCGRIDRIGTVVLLRSAAPLETPTTSETPATLPTFDALPQSDCQIKLTETLFLRAEPAGEIIGLVWLYSEVPVFETSGDWYKVEFEGAIGYISRFYSRVLYGGCI
ncbi:MAG: SH3 domain-containing protein [Chloroflexi bacterium]|nr:SH3 domain-containing protein [Chloroflexota bacterium]